MSSPHLFDHQSAAFAELLARAQAYFRGEWRSLLIGTRWHSLLVGPTGTGKTAIVSLLAKATGAALKRVSIPGFMPAGAHNRAVGETLPSLLKHIASNHKTILFLDEIDKIQHDSPWNSYIRGELFELLDGRWQTDLKTSDGDDEDSVEAVAECTERLTGEKLRTATFVVGAGTFQQFYDAENAEQKVIGFHSSDHEANETVGLNAAMIAERLPRELTNRFNSQLILLPTLAPRHYDALIRQTERSLPKHLLQAFRRAAEKRLPQAIAAKSGCRFVEDALVDALKFRPSGPDCAELTPER